MLFGVFVAILGLGYLYFRLTSAARAATPVDEMLQPGAWLPAWAAAAHGNRSNDLDY